MCSNLSLSLSLSLKHTHTHTHTHKHTHTHTCTHTHTHTHTFCLSLDVLARVSKMPIMTMSVASDQGLGVCGKTECSLFCDWRSIQGHHSSVQFGSVVSMPCCWCSDSTCCGLNSWSRQGDGPFFSSSEWTFLQTCHCLSCLHVHGTH